VHSVADRRSSFSTYHDSAVVIATGYKLDDQEVRVWVPVILTSPYRPNQLWSPPNLLSNGYWGGRGCFPRCQTAGHEADHSPPTSAEVKKTWIYASALSYVFMAWCLVKHRDCFIFTQNGPPFSSFTKF
jgi:hypothetical protein